MHQGAGNEASRREPEIAVVVASHERPVRLRWLLNALAGQTLDRRRWEAVVCDDSADGEVEALLAGHELASAGVLRHLRLPPGTGCASRQRNLGWRLADAPVVAFTDDDCRPHPGWLEQLLEAAGRSPGAVLQGRTYPDPEEVHLLHAAPHARTQDVTPPTWHGQTCNVAYPRALLKRLGGFDEALRQSGGEDADLGLRARLAGARWDAVPDAVVYHAVLVMSFPAAIANAWRWRDLPGVVRRHPQVRADLVARLFWRPSHAWLAPAVAGVVAARRRRALALLAVPWALAILPRRGHSARGRARAVSELPGRALIDIAEFAALAWGSVRHRTIML